LNEIHEVETQIEKLCSLHSWSKDEL